MFQKTVFVSVTNIELDVQTLDKMFPDIENTLEYIDVQIFHELYFKKFENILLRKKKNQTTKKPTLVLGQMFSNMLSSRMLRNMDLWLLHPKTKKILGYLGGLISRNLYGWTGLSGSSEFCRKGNYRAFSDYICEKDGRQNDH